MLSRRAPLVLVVVLLAAGVFGIGAARLKFATGQDRYLDRGRASSTTSTVPVLTTSVVPNNNGLLGWRLHHRSNSLHVASVTAPLDASAVDAIKKAFVTFSTAAIPTSTVKSHRYSTAEHYAQ